MIADNKDIYPTVNPQIAHLLKKLGFLRSTLYALRSTLYAFFYIFVQCWINY